MRISPPFLSVRGNRNERHCPHRLMPALVLLPGIVALQAGAACRDDAGARLLFQRLAGEWSGNAVTTPVGPRPYDMEFERRGNFWIYGRADPGAAIHHWGFYCEDGTLWLRFLSTFRGNRDPVLLQAVEVTNTEIRFRAESPDFLAVEVRPGRERSEFEVLHHGELHVRIELERNAE